MFSLFLQIMFFAASSISVVPGSSGAELMAMILFGSSLTNFIITFILLIHQFQKKT